MKQMRFTELFYSLQGEGLRVGVPSIFLRLFGCNFECKGFSNPDMKDPNIIPVKNLDELADADLELGCDSRYSWHKDYRNLAYAATPDEVVHHVAELANTTMANAKALSGQLPTRVPDLVITGGEPFMQQAQLSRFLNGLISSRGQTWGFDFVLPNITFETNASVPWKLDMKDAFESYAHAGSSIHFSNSPKLAFTGEPRSRALNPDVVNYQQELVSRYERDSGFELSFKFVVRPVAEDFDELFEFMRAYDKDGYLLDKVYVMPVGASLAQQSEIATRVAEMAMARGLKYSPRLQCDLWANKIGT